MRLFNLFGRKNEPKQEVTRLVVEYISLPEDQADGFAKAHLTAMAGEDGTKAFQTLLEEAGQDGETASLIRRRWSALMSYWRENWEENCVGALKRVLASLAS
jgi:hypothetical protein